MWLSLSASASSEYKIRVFVGGVNVVTGRKWDERLPYDGFESEQDYILVPPQEHLDGIAIEKGVVRQFIAMPIGSGYSIEKQITGKEDVGGLQLEITLQNHHLDLFDSKGVPIRWHDDVNSDRFGAMTPRLCMLHVGELLSMKRTGAPNKHPYLGGKIRRLQKRTLQEVIDQNNKAEPSSPMTLTALYPVALKIKMPGTFVRHKITTPQFSPLDSVDKIIEETHYKGQNLKNFNLALNYMLPGYRTIQEVGLYDGAVLVAYKKEKPNPLPPRAPSQAFESKAFSPMSTQLPLEGRSFKDGYTADSKNLDFAPDSDTPTLDQYDKSYGAPAGAFLSSPPLTLSQARHSPSFATNPDGPTLHQSHRSYDVPTARQSSLVVDDKPTHNEISAPKWMAELRPIPKWVAELRPGGPSQRPRPMATNITAEPKPAKKPAESWAMGIAAGGRLAQQIYYDTTPSEFRPKPPFATALVSVQLLNAVAYETLTGMLCPPTPITPKQYVDAGIPWYDTYRGHVQATDGGRAFGKIKSVSEIDGQEDIESSTSIASSQRVSCTMCRRNFCDCVLRPCNHAFCAACVKARMVYYPSRDISVIHCDICRQAANQVLGFSAPMALPGQEDWLPDIGADVIVKSGHFGKAIVFELE
ncbi:hypothetical protein GQ44DRAFT_766193 [Phaeosphaeriaceae sp. PMI808]|nr:hypothetical protein GQ44DRAFT_766193 [Phaeosphaeriaceae sp. PMI808]